MSVYEFRALKPSEYRPAQDVFRIALHEPPASDERWPVIAPLYQEGRCFGGFAGDTVVGTGFSFPSRMTVPGGRRLPAALISDVGVRADHTRRGVLTGVMRELLVNTAEPVAALHASEAVIYGRFGFGVASREQKITVERARARLRPEAPASGSVRMLDREEMWKVLPELFDRLDRGRLGRLDRPEYLWPLTRWQFKERGDRGVAVVHTGPDGEDDGYALYHVRTGDWRVEEHPITAIEVWDLHTSNSAAWIDLARFLLEVDLADVVEFWARPVDDSLDWLLADRRAAKITDVGDELWLRLVDVPAALAARTFPGAAGDEVVLEVRDRILPDNAGRYLVTTAGVERTGRDAQLAVDVDVLAALYLGDVRPSTVATYGRLDVLDAAALPVADRLFAADSAEVPWGGTFF